MILQSKELICYPINPKYFPISPKNQNGFQNFLKALILWEQKDFSRKYI